MPKTKGKKPATGGLKKKGKKSVAGCKKPIKTGLVSTYKTLLKQKGDGTVHRDHIPSAAALKRRGERLANRKLTTSEKRRITERAIAITLSAPVHKSGRTYGGKNTKKQIDSDSKDLPKAAKQDIEVYKKQGVSKALLKTMQTSMLMTQKQYDKIIMDAVNDK